MKRYWILAIVGLCLVSPQVFAGAGPGEVTAVSVLPGAGSGSVVIDVRGRGVSVRDFTLSTPARLVIDVTGATLRAPGSLNYDGANRGGILNLRYAQYKPDVVRIVLELEQLKDYRLERADDAIRIELGTDRAFTAWSSAAPAAMPSVARGGAQSVSNVAPVPSLPRRTARDSGTVFTRDRSQQAQQPVITVSFDNASIADVLASFAEFSGKSILLGANVKGTVTSTIKNQPWDVAMQKILDSQGLSSVEDPPGVITVADPATLAARDSLEPVRTAIIPINYARASALAISAAGALSKRGKLVSDTATNSLILTDVETRIDDDSAFIALLDIPTPQVSIQAKLIFVDRSDIENLGVKYDLGTNKQFFNALVARDDPSTAQPVDTDGDGVPDAVKATTKFGATQNIIDLGGNALSAIANAGAGVANPALNLIFSTAIGNFDLTSFVEALQEVDLADLQAEPLISTADNTMASILVGERTPIRTVDVAAATGGGFSPPRSTAQIVPTGITLRVTPHVTNNGQVLMRLHAENSSIRAAAADIGFTFATQEADNELLVADGETAVIGGLTVTQVTTTKSGIPFLVDLPILGRIFGFSSRIEQRRDLLILVTPHIIKDPGAQARNQ